MPSIVPGLEYDIFISYRHNDNRSGWVTDFVNALQEELASTIKEPLSIYFDKNPHDGLLETHNVDKSLEGKLKCLIFIPILSQTYCDPKSFAWQQEFCVFNNLTKEDPLGRDIKLSSGNVASRMLPIKIHDLDAEDKAIIESEIERVLRAIEFIYKEAGVNRPLLSTDNSDKNINKTSYRNQVNKVANAVKELIHGMKFPAIIKSQEKPGPLHAKKRTRKPTILVAVIAVLVVTSAYFIYLSQSVKADEFSSSEKSIAVLPFANLSNDPEQEYFSDGITEQIITNLAHITSLKVIARTSVMKYKKTDKTIAQIGKELNVTHVLEGSIRTSNNRVRVTAQLIAVNDESHVWAQDYDRKLEDIFTVQDEVSIGIASQLERKLTPKESEVLKTNRPANVEAYSHFLKGFLIHDVYYVKRLKEDFTQAENELKMATELDANYGQAYAALADLYDTYANFSAQGPKEKLKFQALRDSLSNMGLKLSPRNAYVMSIRAYTFSNKLNRTEQDVDSTFKYLNTALKISPNDLSACDQVSVEYHRLGLFIQAIQYRELAISLDPTFGVYYANLASIYLDMGDFEKSEKTLNKALLLEPDGVFALEIRARVRILRENFIGAEEDIQHILAINSQGINRFQEAWFSAMKAVKTADKEKALSLLNHWSVYLALGMKKEALDGLEKDQNLKYLNLKNSLIFDPLRSDPRFEKLLEQTRLVYEERLKRYAN